MTGETKHSSTGSRECVERDVRQVDGGNADPRAGSRECVERDRAYMGPTARIPYYDLVVDHARGALLFDAEGNEYIDLFAAATSANVGHSHPAVAAAIAGQAHRVIQCPPAYFYHAPEAELVEKLAHIAPGTSAKRVVFGTSGSDANDAIIKFARAYTQRPYIVTFQGAYHGSTYGSITMSAISLGMRRKIGPMLPGIYHIPYPDVHRAGIEHLAEAEQAEHFMRPLLEMTSTYLPPDEIACIVMEPIAGDAGIIVPPPAYLDALYAFCRAHGILFAVDEINQGMGRTGTWWGIEQFGIEPDLMSVGKSLASGMPLSAIVGKAEIMESLSFPAHIFTTSGNPVCCAAALATIRVIEEENLLERSRVLGARAKGRFEDMAARFGIVGGVHGMGLNLGIDIVEPGTREKNARDALKVVFRAFEEGVVIISMAESVLRFQPPLVIGEEELERALGVLERVIGEVDAGLVPDSIVPAGRGW